MKPLSVASVFICAIFNAAFGQSAHYGPKVKFALNAGDIETFVRDGAREYPMLAFRQNTTGPSAAVCATSGSASASASASASGSGSVCVQSAHWVTIGYPRIVVYQNVGNTVAFFMNNSTLSFDLQFLTDNDKKALAAAASQTFGVTVHVSQIVQSTILAVSCRLEILADGQPFTLYGSSQSGNPMSIEFQWPSDKQLKSDLQKTISEWSSSDVYDEFTEVYCDVSATVPSQSLAALEINKTAVDTLLQYGSNNQPAYTYVTYTQIKQLASNLIDTNGWASKYAISQTSLAQSLITQMQKSGVLGKYTWHDAATVLAAAREPDVNVDDDDDDDEEDEKEVKLLLDSFSKLVQATLLVDLKPRSRGQTLCFAKNQDYIKEELVKTAGVFRKFASVGNLVNIINATCRQVALAEQLAMLNNDSTSDVRWTKARMQPRIEPENIRSMVYYSKASATSLSFTVAAPLKHAGAGANANYTKSYSLHVRQQYALADRNLAALNSKLMHLTDKIDDLSASTTRLHQSLTGVSSLHSAQLLNEAFTLSSLSREACRVEGAVINETQQQQLQVCAVRCYLNSTCEAFTHDSRTSCTLLTATSSSSTGSCTYRKNLAGAAWRSSVLRQMSQVDNATSQLNTDVNQLIRVMSNINMTSQCASSQPRTSITTQRTTTTTLTTTTATSTPTTTTTVRRPFNFNVSCITSRDADSCYYFSASRANWIEAQTFCWKAGMYLIAIGSQDEQSDVALYMQTQRANVSHWYIGLNNIGLFNTYLWSSGWQNDKDNENDKYTNWQSGRPSGAALGCVQMDKAGDYKWTDVDCNQEAYFVCEKTVRNKTRTQVALPAACNENTAPTGSSLIAGAVLDGTAVKIFQVHTAVHSYDSAKRMCKSIGFELGQIKTNQMWLDLHNLIVTNHLQTLFFVGLEHSRSGTWQWYQSGKSIRTGVYTGTFAWKHYGLTTDPEPGDTYGVLRMDSGIMTIASIPASWQCSTLQPTNSCYFICTCP